MEKTEIEEFPRFSRKFEPFLPLISDFVSDIDVLFSAFSSLSPKNWTFLGQRFSSLYPTQRVAYRLKHPV